MNMREWIKQMGAGAGMRKAEGSRGRFGYCYRCEKRPVGEMPKMTEKAALKQ